MAEQPVKTRPQSSAIKAELVKHKLESRRSRTVDGMPVASYTAIKEAGTSTKINPRTIRESRSFSDPDIFQSLVILDAHGLFSKANNSSSFKGSQEVNVKKMSSEHPVFMSPKENQSKDNVKNLAFSFEKVSTEFDPKHHLAEFSNPLHKGNQPRFRKGGGVLPSKPLVSPKPVVAPKPPRLIQNTPKVSKDEPCPKEEDISVSNSNSCHNIDKDDGSYATISHKRPSFPHHPPPRKPISKTKGTEEVKTVMNTNDNTIESYKEPQQQKEDNEKENESQTYVQPPLYAQVDKSKKKSHLKNIEDSKVSTKNSRSDSDPLPSNISIASELRYEIREEDSNVKQCSPENETDIVSESDSEDGWDPDEFEDDDSSDFDEDNSRSNSQGETMVRSVKIFFFSFR